MKNKEINEEFEKSENNGDIKIAKSNDEVTMILQDGESESKPNSLVKESNDTTNSQQLNAVNNLRKTSNEVKVATKRKLGLVN